MFSKTRSAPLPKGITVIPSLPIGDCAAKGAGIGAGIYANADEAFASLEKLQVIEPKQADRAAYAEAYARWKEVLASKK